MIKTINRFFRLYIYYLNYVAFFSSSVLYIITFGILDERKGNKNV